MEELKCKEYCYNVKEMIPEGFINSSFLSVLPHIYLRTRLNFLAWVTKLSAPRTAVINQLSWHTIKKRL